MFGRVRVIPCVFVTVRVPGYARACSCVSVCVCVCSCVLVCTGVFSCVRMSLRVLVWLLFVRVCPSVSVCSGVFVCVHVCSCVHVDYQVQKITLLLHFLRGTGSGTVSYNDHGRVGRRASEDHQALHHYVNVCTTSLCLMSSCATRLAVVGSSS